MLEVTSQSSANQQLPENPVLCHHPAFSSPTCALYTLLITSYANILFVHIPVNFSFVTTTLLPKIQVKTHTFFTLLFKTQQLHNQQFGNANCPDNLKVNIQSLLI